MYSQVASVGDLWNKNWHLLSEDIQFLRRRELKSPHLELSSDDIQNLCLVEIEKLLRTSGKKLSDFPGLPIPATNSLYLLSNTLLADELQYDSAALAAAFELQVRKLNAEQQNAFDQIIESIHQDQHKLFFVDGFGAQGRLFCGK
ncbi:hypothetical protein LINPERPRIM_LOCUS29866 [Linum perenne]